MADTVKENFQFLISNFKFLIMEGDIFTRSTGRSFGVPQDDSSISLPTGQAGSGQAEGREKGGL